MPLIPSQGIDYRAAYGPYALPSRTPCDWPDICEPTKPQRVMRTARPDRQPFWAIVTTKEPPVEDILFDSWTRRRFGLAAGGIAAVLASLALPDQAPAKRKRCKKSEKRCGRKCVKGSCCPGKPCGGDDFCRCGRTIGGKTICFQPIVALCEQCNGDADCNSPLRCIRAGDCGAVTAICLPPCGAEP
jgi:hypothetical protein